MVVNLAVGDTVMVEETATVERHTTFPTHKALRVPLHIKSSDVVLHDCTMAAATLGGKHIKIVLFTVHLAVLLMEAPLTERLTALGAEEVLRVPGLIQGGHTFIQDGAVAVGTPWREKILIIGLAERLAFPLKETLCTQFHLAVGTDEVLWVPRLAKSSHNLPYNLLLACATKPFGHRTDPLPADVRL